VPFDAETLRAAERLEADALADRARAAAGLDGNPLGVALDRVGDAVLTIYERLDHPLLNRVAGLGVDEPAFEVDVGSIIDAYRQRGLRRFSVTLAGIAQPPELPAWLARAGFAPRGGSDLYKHLRQKGFQDAELVQGGLVGQGQSGHYDRFRGRLLWPIRETNGDTIGFGARRIFDDDRIDAKYLNTPETPIYKKSHVLYGIDLARRDIARSSQAVVVEGYTDVMAAHLSGVKTAVATCGTAFGDDHSRVLRRLLQDHDEFRG